MDISSLSEAINEDLNPLLSRMQSESDWGMVVVVECDDWSSQKGRRRFELRCDWVVECRCSPGAFERLGFFASHPLLLSHMGQQSQLFFSSAPVSAGEILLAALSSIEKSLGGWRSPEEILSHKISSLRGVLAQGHGSLALGPSSVIEAIASDLNGLIDVTVVPSHKRDTNLVALTFDSQWLLCEAVQVVEIGS